MQCRDKEEGEAAAGDCFWSSFHPHFQPLSWLSPLCCIGFVPKLSQEQGKPTDPSTAVSPDSTNPENRPMSKTAPKSRLHSQAPTPVLQVRNFCPLQIIFSQSSPFWQGVLARVSAEGAILPEPPAFLGARKAAP